MEQRKIDLKNFFEKVAERRKSSEVIFYLTPNSQEFIKERQMCLLRRVSINIEKVEKPEDERIEINGEKVEKNDFIRKLHSLQRNHIKKQ